jgi:hypothetical protein
VRPIGEETAVRGCLYAIGCAFALTSVASSCGTDRGDAPAASPAPAAAPSGPAAQKPAPDLRTDFEKSGGTETPRYAETMAYARKLEAASPMVRVTRFGTSPQGRDLPLIIVDAHGDFTPEAVRARGNAVVLVEACLHAGESEGKDAGLMLVRDLVAGAQKGAGLLDRVTLLFIPIFNADGHERFGPFNRINQNGPKEMGWRTTANNLNLNRDFMKADAPEMQAWLRLFNAWLPDFFVDTHTTDGADYQYQLTYSIELAGNMDPGVTAWAKAYIGEATRALGAEGILSTSYVMFKSWGDPRSGIVAYAAGPRFSQGYTAIQNRPGLLLETHMLKGYATRVRATYAMLRETLRTVGERRDDLVAAVKRADERAASPEFREEPLVVEFETTEKSEPVDFLGVEFDVAKSDLTGGDWFEYGRAPKTYKVPFFGDIVPKTTVSLPRAYLVPPEWAEVIARLGWHGVAVRRLASDRTVKVRTYRFQNASFSPGGWFGPPGRPYEGRQMAAFDLEPVDVERTYPAGTAVIDTAQRTSRVIAHLLEPAAPDSFARWGFFNAIFQPTEYAEAYVMEKVAREMLAKDPSLAGELAAAKKKSLALAQSPEAILDWFYERTPYYDKNVGLYPVGRIEDDAVFEALLGATEAAPAQGS